MANQKDKALNKQRVLEVAFKLFHENGIYSTKISDVAKKSGFTSMSIYRYFQNKDTLVLAVADHFAKWFCDDVSQYISQIEYEHLTGLQQQEVLLRYIIKQAYFKNRYLLLMNELVLYLSNMGINKQELMLGKHGNFAIEKASRMSFDTFVKGTSDGSMRNDLSPERLFFMTTVSLHGIMQTIAGQFYSVQGNEDQAIPSYYYEDCVDMLLKFIK